ncbi:MAG: hypothetical protein KAY37_02235, partial [Phycisphaerae bacterium]|nr:hypothetical protein [Phycisphaerae bacterium]
RGSCRAKPCATAQEQCPSDRRSEKTLLKSSGTHAEREPRPPKPTRAFGVDRENNEPAGVVTAGGPFRFGCKCYSHVRCKHRSLAFITYVHISPPFLTGQPPGRT